MAFRTVLCPVDFSKPSRIALRYAAAVAGTDGQVTVLFVNDPHTGLSEGTELHQQLDKAKDQVIEQSQKLAADQPKGPPSRIRPDPRLSEPGSSSRIVGHPEVSTDLTVWAEVPSVVGRNRRTSPEPPRETHGRFAMDFIPHPWPISSTRILLALTVEMRHPARR